MKIQNQNCIKHHSCNNIQCIENFHIKAWTVTRQRAAYLVMWRSQILRVDTSLQRPSSKSRPTLVFPDACSAYREDMISIALSPAFSASVLGTISKLSANFAIAYWSNLQNHCFFSRLLHYCPIRNLWLGKWLQNQVPIVGLDINILFYVSGTTSWENNNSRHLPCFCKREFLYSLS